MVDPFIVILGAVAAAAADPLTTLDITIVSAIVLALAAAVTSLWLAFKARADRVEAAQKDLVDRIRKLEEDRLTEVKEYARKSEETNKRVLAVFGNVVDALRNLTETMSEWNKRPCIADAVDAQGKKLHPTPVPEVKTEVLLRHDERVRKHQQEESAGP